ncbi:NAD-dependent protein deacetylase [Cognatilysobacter bugurensis]|nr:NAD-dependent protein deacetylase [Lysobacter bugurensis]
MNPDPSIAPPSATDAAAASLEEWLRSRRNVFLLTGAGCSTASGIPDYRAPDGSWKRRPPVTYQAFIEDPRVRQRYWARSTVGWPRVGSAQPNAAHLAIVELQRRSLVSLLLTQNVDGLHDKAGSGDVLDLHGRIDTVRCLVCARIERRPDLQLRLLEANPSWRAVAAQVAPDGDAELEDADTSGFNVPDCRNCGGMLKPDVVFFGENVPGERVRRAYAALEQSDGLLVVGSSLMVYSGFRFARLAHERGCSVAILTQGTTRADSLAALKLDADCVATLPATIARLS